mgnify:CR=1 FL=1
MKKEKAFFKNRNFKVAGILFFPDDFDPSKKYPALVATHPGGGVKEQVSSLYGGKLADRGYVVLAFDASHQGESGGEPRFLEDPFARVEDIRCAIDFLVTLPYVDEERIGAFGVCAGGGYSVSAAQIEHRIKAVAGISAWDVGDSSRNGVGRIFTEEDTQKLLDEVARQRTREARGEPPLYVGYVPNSADEFTDETPAIQREACEYYRTPRAAHPNSPNKMLFTSWGELAAFDAFAHADLISPRPLLLIVGSEADTIYFSETAYEKAREPKEMFFVKGATHVDLYDREPYVAQVCGKLSEFFGKALKGESAVD